MSPRCAHTESMPKNKATGVAAEVTAYLNAAAPDGKAGYERLRELVRVQAGADRVSERLSYQIPTFFVDGKRLLHVGLWREYLAVYPIPDSEVDATLGEDLEPHRQGKGTLHFRYADPWPAELVERLVAAHLERVG